MQQSRAVKPKWKKKKIAVGPQRFKIVNEALKIKHHTIHAWLHRIILACVWCVCVVWLHNQTHSRRPLFSIGINWMGTPGLFVKCQIDTWKPQLLPSSSPLTPLTLCENMIIQLNGIQFDFSVLRSISPNIAIQCVIFIAIVIYWRQLNINSWY